jgi:hypothetical protein
MFEAQRHAGGRREACTIESKYHSGINSFDDPGGHVRAIPNEDCDYMRYVDDESKP